MDNSSVDGKEEQGPLNGCGGNHRLSIKELRYNPCHFSVGQKK